MDVVILAGGLGTRLREAVKEVPKPLAPVAGRPFLEHQMDCWIAQGATRFVLSVGYRHELIQAHFGRQYSGIPVAYAVEAEQLGTGGGLLLALASVAGDQPVLVTNGDTFFPVDAAAMRGAHRANAADFTLALLRIPAGGRYTPVEVLPDGRVTSLAADAARSKLANGGVYVVNPSLLATLGYRPGERVSLEAEMLPRLLASGARVFGVRSEAPFIDIGVPEDYARAASVIAPTR